MKKLFSIMLVLIISFTLATTAFAAEPSRLEAGVKNPSTASGWAQDTINGAFSEGFLSFDKLFKVYTDSYAVNQRGLSAGETQVFEDRLTFAETPNFQANITRAEFAKMCVIWVMCETKTLPADLTKKMGNDYILGSWTGGPPLVVNPNGQIGVGIDGNLVTFKDIKYGYNIEIRDNKVYQDGVYYPCTNSDNYPPLRLDDVLIEYAYQFGIVGGTRSEPNKDLPQYTDRWFSPDATLTREQAATMIMRAVKFVELVNSGADMSNQQDVWSKVQAASGTSDQGFADISTASTWATDAINFCKANGIMNGTSNDHFSPKSNYTIEQAIMTFSNVK